MEELLPDTINHTDNDQEKQEAFDNRTAEEFIACSARSEASILRAEIKKNQTQISYISTSRDSLPVLIRSLVII